MFISIDPGNKKFGYAIFDNNQNIISKGIKPVSEFENFSKHIKNKFGNAYIIIGNGTEHKYFFQTLKFYFDKIDLTDEKYTTEEARKLYFKENPPKGWKKFIPLTLLTPQVDIDDYAAIAIAQRFFCKIQKNL